MELRYLFYAARRLVLVFSYWRWDATARRAVKRCETDAAAVAIQQADKIRGQLYE